MIIETWSDVVCPWCYIGKRRLERALASTGVEAEVVHRAFQLDPSAHTEGRKTVDVLAHKYGVSPAEAAAMMDQVTDIARGEGLDYHLADTQSGNTADAHRVILWAQDTVNAAAGQRLADTIMQAYFCNAQPVFTPKQLLPLVAQADLDESVAADMLTTSAYLDVVAADQIQAREFGATGVPFFVIDRQFGIAGAQPLEVFEGALRKALSQ